MAYNGFVCSFDFWNDVFFRNTSAEKTAEKA
jgi:hypothetical protein